MVLICLAFVRVVTHQKEQVLYIHTLSVLNMSAFLR